MKKNFCFCLYCMSFLLCLCFYTPIFAAYFEKCHHLDSSQIIILFSVYSFSTFLFEIPTGIIGDVLGEKTSLLMGAFLTIISTFLFLMNSFVYFVIAQIIYGMAQTFFSGSFESYAFKFCRQNNRDYDKTLSKLYSLQWCALCFSFALCFFFVRYSLVIPFYATIIANFLCLVSALLLPALNKVERRTDRMTFASFFSCFTENRQLLFICIIHSWFSMVLIVGYQLFQVLFSEKSFSADYNAVIYFFATLFAILGSFFYGKINKNQQVSKVLLSICIILLALIFFFLFAVSYFFAILILVCLYRFVWGQISPLLTALMNKNIKSDSYRNTIFSFNSLVTNIFSTLLLYAFSFIPVYRQFMILGFITLMLLSIVFFIKGEK